MKVNNNEAQTTISNEALDRLFSDTHECEQLESKEVLMEEDCDKITEPKKRFKLTDETIEYKNHKLYRIQCIESFIVDNLRLKEDYSNDELTIKEGELGGFVESENNLADNAWIQENAKVFENAKVYGSAVVAGNAEVRDNAEVRGNALVYDNAHIESNAEIYGKAIINDDARIHGHARVYGKAKVGGHAKIGEYTKVFGTAYIDDYVEINGDAEIEDSTLEGKVKIAGNAKIGDVAIKEANAKILNDAYIQKVYDYMCFTNVGSRTDTLTAYRTKHNGVRITVGCFFGDLDEFRKDVAKKGKDEELLKKEYELIANVIQHRFIDNNTEDYLKNAAERRLNI